MNFSKEAYLQLSGDLFAAVQSGGIFEDSKTFVDSIPISDPASIIKTYREEKIRDSFDLKKFVLSNFEIPFGKEEKIDLPEGRSMKEHIKLLWEILKRDVPPGNKKFTTLIPLPKPYIVPGGRFREIYYWDSYFTMHGLLADGENDTVENMIDNFTYLISKVGFIPNGNRIYYLTRSQPPFFAAMIDLVCRFKNDYNWGVNYLPALETEYSFWCSDKLGKDKNPHIITLPGGIILNRYFDREELPREESYLEDLSTAETLSPSRKKNLFKNIRAACESGWDFSSRWFQDQKTLTSCITTDILPLDLNCLLYFSEILIAKLNRLNGDMNKYHRFSDFAKVRAETINHIFWDNKENFYCDFNWKTGNRTAVFSLAACYPLYFKIAGEEMADSVKEKIESEFLKEGGVTTTLNLTGQQWDAPNGWAPLQWITIKGLRNYGFNTLADKIKQRWLTLNEKVFERTGKMMEKYNVYDTAIHAGGGEYPLQDGFGWTNGIASALMNDLDEQTE
jgi:alpha,alpha-trehalase